MTLFLGIDTGGTYTDAVLYDEAAPAPGVVAKAKALTTKADLSIGIGQAVDRVLTETTSREISLVSLSTTLATNALVEGQGGRICLVLIGFDDAALTRAGLADAVGQDPVVFVAGGHTASGERQAPLDQDALRVAVATYASDVDAFAIVAYFGTRDPIDEITAREIVGASGLPVTCGHELASSLNGPKRALTAVLNARLIGMIAALIQASEAILRKQHIDAPLMLVRGDGSLVSAEFARLRPIETILSGPAASLVGAAHLAQVPTAVVSDIGGTTTDIAVLRDGRPALSARGATVGPHETMVEAVDMVTHGLGGDSEVAVDDHSLTPRLLLGPRRVIPICLLAQQHPETVHQILDRHLGQSTPSSGDGRFILRGEGAATGLREGDTALLEALTATPQAFSDVIRSRMQTAALRRLVSRGLARVSAFTPTDAVHVLGFYDDLDASAARKGASLMARKRDAGGRPVAETATAFAELTRTSLIRRSAEVLLEAALAQDGFDGAALSQTALARAALDGHAGAARLQIGLDYPLVGLGASAPLYYPSIAETLGTTPVVPAHADVANAVGAVVGRVRLTVETLIVQPAEGSFRVYLTDGTQEFPALEPALEHAKAALNRSAMDQAATAGAENVELTEIWSPKVAPVEGRDVFIEGTLQIVATGRPRLTKPSGGAKGAG